MKRFLYFWLGIVVLMGVSVGTQDLTAQLAAIVASYTNFWGGLGTMLLVVSALVAWWMTHTPRWVGLIAQKMDVRQS